MIIQVFLKDMSNLVCNLLQCAENFRHSSWSYSTNSSGDPDLGVPAAHVIGQQPQTLALANKHLLWDQLEGGVLITLCSPVILDLL